MNFNGDCQNKTDNELVKLVLENAEWYGCLMQRYEEKLARYIYRISGNSQEDIEDLLQEIFLAVYRNLNDFDNNLKFSSWIYRITHNHVISNHRKIKARIKQINGEDGEKLLSIMKDNKDLGEIINDKITGEVLSKLLDQIDGKYKEVLVLRYLEEKEYNEISDILKKPVATIGTLLSRAKKNMHTIIIKEGIEL
ncbi:MAG: RNA polymerase sigma factor [Candidatus Kerfeldbacteria bacterium]